MYDIRCAQIGDLPELDRLMHQLSPTSGCTVERLKAVIDASDSHLYVLTELTDGNASTCNERVIACATLCVLHTPEQCIGYIEAVAVLESHRGRGLGRKLMEHVLGQARKLGVDQLHLTSNPRREAANALYKSLGFELYETNFYRLYE